ncbi:exonuclease SbcCD subunit D [Nocardia sp. CA-120079]|uniref:exonuclease SbcCD subunit D n=1 Tax=Nocardia sp. CA-120079 TaxID=3239974 RepID=UPI003D97C386
MFHTSDWHLGRQISRHRRDAEFDAVVNEIIEIATDFTPDLIVHSGDLFDGRPSTDDFRRAAEALRRLGEVAPVVVVAGNHDTPQVLTFLEYILTDMGTRPRDQVRVRFATDARPDGLLLAEYPAAAGDLTLRIGALPYLHPNRFAYDFTDPAMTTATYARRMRAVQADVYRRLASGRGPRDLLVFAAHLFVAGATPSYSERKISLAEDYAVDVAALPVVDYGALGHIHKPQRVENIGFPACYAGSPLQLDFGEIRDSKSVALVEIAPGEEPRIGLEPLSSGRRLVKLTGSLEEIAQRAGRVGDAWVKIEVDLDGPDPALSRYLADLLPRATIVGIEERRPGAVERVLDSDAAATELPGVEDLLREYLPGRGVSGMALDRVMATLAQLQAEPDPADLAPCCEEEMLTAAIAGYGFKGIDRGGVLIDPALGGSEAR